MERAIRNDPWTNHSSSVIDLVHILSSPDAAPAQGLYLALTRSVGTPQGQS